MDKQLARKLGRLLDESLPSLVGRTENKRDTIRDSVLRDDYQRNKFNQPSHLTFGDVWGRVNVPLRSASITKSRVLDATHDLVGGVNETLVADVLRAGWNFTVNTDNEAIENRVLESIEVIEGRLHLRQQLNDLYRSALVDGDLFVQLSAVRDNGGQYIDKLVLLEAMTMQRNTNDIDLFYRGKPGFIQHTDGIFIEEDNTYTRGDVNVYALDTVKNQYDMWEIVHGRTNHVGTRRYGSPKLNRILDDARHITVGLKDLAQRRFEGAGVFTSWIFGTPENPENDPALQDELLEALNRRKERKQSGEMVHNHYVGGYPLVPTQMQGDKDIDRVADIKLHIDNFFAGSPVPSIALGFFEDINRDVIPIVLDNYNRTIKMESRWIADEILVPIMYRSLAAEGLVGDLRESQLGVEWEDRIETKVEDLKQAAETVKMLKESGLNNPEMLLQFMRKYDQETFDDEFLLGMIDETVDESAVNVV